MERKEGGVNRLLAYIKAIGRPRSTVGWDHCPVRLFVRDNGPKLQRVVFVLPLA